MQANDRDSASFAGSMRTQTSSKTFLNETKRKFALFGFSDQYYVAAPSASNIVLAC
jgi:hypothetical protein